MSLKVYVFMKHMANDSVCVYVSASAGSFKDYVQYYNPWCTNFIISEGTQFILR